MRIVLIEPKSPGLHIFSNFRIPRLGILLLGTILSRAGHKVSVVFEEAGKVDWKLLRSADLVGVSTITSTAPHAYEIADTLRADGVPVVLGGAHPTMLPDEAMRHADWVLRGEADETILPLVEAISGGRGFDTVLGLTWRQGENLVHNPPAPPVADLDSVPPPDLSLLVRTSSSITMSKTIVPVLTSRGCPYDCSFCSVTAMFGRRYRFRSTESVMQELRGLNLDGKRIFFYDDNFTANPKRTQGLLEAMIREGITPSWSSQVHTDCARHPNLLAAMKDSGCETVYIGLESISPHTLESYQKAQTVESMERALAAIHSAGIDVHGMFVFGGDGDDAQSIRKTAEWAKAQGIATVQFLILTPFPGSRTFTDFEAEGRLILRDWSLYDTHHVVFRPKRLTPHELQVETFRAQGAFYSWGQVLERLFARDMLNTIIRLYAHHMNGRWLRHHRDFVRFTQYLGAPE